MPSANGNNPAATAELAPPLDPAADFDKSYAFEVDPKSLLIVCPPTPSSAVFVFPTTITPFSINRFTNNEFFLGWLFFEPGNPYVVLKPSTSVRSLIAVSYTHLRAHET